METAKHKHPVLTEAQGLRILLIFLFFTDYNKNSKQSSCPTDFMER